MVGAPSGTHLHPAGVCHCEACPRKCGRADEGNGIWSVVGNDMVIYAGEGNCGGALAGLENDAYEGMSGDVAVFLVSDHADVRGACPGYSQHSWPCASSLENGASCGDDGASRPC